MALSKKGLRKIIIDGEGYVWKGGEIVSPYGDTFRFFAQEANREGTLLVLDVVVHHAPNQLRQQMEIGPKVISEAIRFALSKGWKPKERLPQYKIDFPIETSQREMVQSNAV